MDKRTQARELRQQGFLQKEIASRLGVCHKTAWRWTKDIPVDPRVGYDKTFLDTDTELRSYFLGFFVADGWVEGCGNHFHLSCIDEQIIRDIAVAVSYRNKIIRGTAGWGCNKTKGMHRLSFASRPLAQIKAMGFTSNKTGHEFIPKAVSDQTFPHFMRGLTDGDGTWGVVQGKYLSWGLVCASDRFLMDVLHRVRTLGVVEASGVKPEARPTKNGVIYRIRFGHQDSVALGGFMYQDATLMLRRKHRVYTTHRELRLKHHRWTQAELKMARDGVQPPNRTQNAFHWKRWEKGWSARR